MTRRIERRLEVLERAREEQAAQRPQITAIIVHGAGADPDIVTHEEMILVHGRWIPYQERFAPLCVPGADDDE